MISKDPFWSLKAVWDFSYLLYQWMVWLVISFLLTIHIFVDLRVALRFFKFDRVILLFITSSKIDLKPRSTILPTHNVRSISVPPLASIFESTLPTSISEPILHQFQSPSINFSPPHQHQFQRSSHQHQFWSPLHQFQHHSKNRQLFL